MTQSKHSTLLPRRNLVDLVTMYELEPSLRDIYVEGPHDRAIFNWYLEIAAHQHVSVIEIESIDIPSEKLFSHGLTSGNRDRVITLALELDSQYPTRLPFVRCIIDSDFDLIFESKHEANHLLYTDYTSVDMYSYDEALLRKVLCLGFHVPESALPSLFNSMTSILHDIFIIRAAVQKLGWGIPLVSFVRCCKVNNSSIVFDRSDFVHRCLNASDMQDERATLEALCNNLAVIKLNDPKHSIHSEDYFELIGWYLARRCNWSGYARGKRSIMSNLIVALDHSVLRGQNLFVELDQVFG